MAINEIAPADSLSNVIQQAQSNNALSSFSARLNAENQILTPGAANARSSLLQNEQLINTTLRNLPFTAEQNTADTLADITAPQATVPGSTEVQDILLQSELLINQTLANVGFTSQTETNSLLINETPAELEADQNLQPLNTIQQNELLTNKVLDGLNPATGATTPTVTETQTAGTTTTSGNLANQARQAIQGLNAELAAETTASLLTLVTGESRTIFSTNAVNANFAPEPASAFTLPFSLLNPDRTPYVVVVYETRNPAPDQGEPIPPPTDIPPAQPVGRVRPVDRAVLRQAWATYQERKPPETTNQVSIPVAERDLRHVLNRVNEDLTANGMPLHLVFVKNTTDDCSNSEICRITRDIPLKSENLTTTLDNLQHETGILIDTTS